MKHKNYFDQPEGIVGGSKELKSGFSCCMMPRGRYEGLEGIVGEFLSFKWNSKQSTLIPGKRRKSPLITSRFFAFKMERTLQNDFLGYPEPPLIL